MALTWLPSKPQPGVSSCCSATGTRICSYTCCAIARQMCEGCPSLWLALSNKLKSLPPRAGFSVLGGAGWCQPDPHCFSSPSQKPPALTESACLCSLPLLPPRALSLLSSVQCSGRGESHSSQILCNKVPLRTAQMSSLSAVCMPLTAWCRHFHVGCTEVDLVRFIGKGTESIPIQSPQRVDWRGREVDLSGLSCCAGRFWGKAGGPARAAAG